MLDDIWGMDPKSLRILPTMPQPVEAAAEPSPDGKPALSPYQFAKKIEKAMDEYVRPMLRKDGGDVQIVDIKDAAVYCQLIGACAGCCAAGQTLKMMIERTLKEMVDERIRVIAV